MKNFAVTAEDFNDIAETALSLIDPKSDIKTIVLPDTLDPRALSALKRLRPTIGIADIPATQTEALPAHYFLVRSFAIVTTDAEPEASIQGQLGPVSTAMTDANLPDCGRIYTVAYVLQGGGWFSPSYKVENCSESRHWVPVDAQNH